MSTTITIKTTRGEQRVKADAFGNWAVHEHWNGKVQRRSQWAITHVPSGHCIPEFYTENLSKATAIKCAKALAEKFNDVPFGDKKAGRQMAELIWRVALGEQA